MPGSSNPQLGTLTGIKGNNAKIGQRTWRTWKNIEKIRLNRRYEQQTSINIEQSNQLKTAKEYNLADLVQTKPKTEENPLTLRTASFE